MLLAYLNVHVPEYSELLLQSPPSKAREFVAHYKVNPSALEHFNAQQLLENADLWLVGTQEAKERGRAGTRVGKYVVMWDAVMVQASIISSANHTRP